MTDQISAHRTARLLLHLPAQDGGTARYALVGYEVRRGIPRGAIYLDGVIPGAPAAPSLEHLLALFDSALHREMLID